MRVETHSYHCGQEVFFSFGERYGVFSGAVLGTALKPEGTIGEVERKWLIFFQQHGWEIICHPLNTASPGTFTLLHSEHACIGLAFTTGHAIHELLLALQGMFIHGRIEVGIVCIAGEQLFTRLKTDLAWLRPVVTVPLWVVALK